MFCTPKESYEHKEFISGRKSMSYIQKLKKIFFQNFFCQSYSFGENCSFLAQLGPKLIQNNPHIEIPTIPFYEPPLTKNYDQIRMPP